MVDGDVGAEASAADVAFAVLVGEYGLPDDVVSGEEAVVAAVGFFAGKIGAELRDGGIDEGSFEDVDHGG